MKNFWEDVVYQTRNTILFVYNTLQAYESTEDHGNQDEEKMKERQKVGRKQAIFTA